jgi:acyl carrier protein
MTLDQGKFSVLLQACDRILDLDGPVQAETQLVDAGVDSVKMVELITVLENEFDVDIPLELLTLQSLSSPMTIWNALCSAEPR